MSCFLEKIWSKCGKMLRFDIFSLLCCIFERVYNLENVWQKGVSRCPCLILCWGPASANMRLGVYHSSTTDHRSFKPSHNPGKEVSLWPHFIEEAVEAQTGEVICPRTRTVIKFQAPKPPSYNMHLETLVLSCQSKLWFFKLSGGLDSVLKGIDQHFWTLCLVAEGNLGPASPSPPPSDRRQPR